MKEKGYAVVVVAEGAGEEILGETGETDATGYVLLCCGHVRFTFDIIKVADAVVDSEHIFNYLFKYILTNEPWCECSEPLSVKRRKLFIRSVHHLVFEFDWRKNLKNTCSEYSIKDNCIPNFINSRNVSFRGFILLFLLLFWTE